MENFKSSNLQQNGKTVKLIPIDVNHVVHNYRRGSTVRLFRFYFENEAILGVSGNGYLTKK